MKKGKSIIVILVSSVIIAWALLFFTSSAVLVWATERDGSLGTILQCRYFTGTGLVTYEHLKTDIDLIGREVCPRIVDLD